MNWTPRIVGMLAGVAAAMTAFAADLPNGGRLSLADVDRIVGERNRTIVAARRGIEAAEAGVEMAAARPNPTVSFDASRLNSRRTVGTNMIESTLRIDQPFERGGKRELRLAVADSLVAASRSDETESIRQQTLLARQAYFDLKAAEAKAQLSRDSADLAAQVLTKADLRLKAGDLSPADVARVRTDAMKAQAEARQARVDLQRARLALAQALAVESEVSRISAADDWPALTPLPDTQAEIEARPDIAAARKRLEAAESNIALAKAQRVRDITIGAQVERDNSPDTRGNNLVGLGVSVPLFIGNDFRGEIRKAHVDRDSAKDDLERLRATASAEIDQAAVEAEEFSQRARHLAEDALPAARKAATAVQLAFTHGAASVLDVIDARRSLHAVEIDTANALADAAKARAAWAAATNRISLP